MKILLFGKDGQVGWELQRELLPLGELTAMGRGQVDFSEPEMLREVVRNLQPDLIVNAAAYTAVDKAEEEAQLAMQVNAVAPGVLAEEAARLNAVLIHYSTDYVFDGSKNSAYLETDIPNPLSVYGRSKLAGERAIQAAGCVHLILRTSWVYGLRRQNFMTTMLRLAREREELRVVDDQLGCPTWSGAIAEATAEVIAHIIMRKGGYLAEKLEPYQGVYHYCAQGEVSWHGFASEILRRDPKREEQCLQRLIAIPSSEYATAAVRPACSMLDTTKIRSTFGLEIKGWQKQLARVMELI